MTFQKKKQEETKRKRTYLKTQHFLPILSIERMLFYYLRRPFYGFCFCFQYWPNRLCGPGGLSSRAWMPQPKMPGRVPREVDLFSSYPFPLQQQQQRKTHGMTETRVWQSRRRRMAQPSVKRRQKVARRWAKKWLRYLGRVPDGGGGVMWRGRAQQAGRASFTDGVRSGQREESTIQRRDRTVGGSVVGQREELAVRTVLKRQARRDHGNEGISAVLLF